MQMNMEPTHAERMMDNAVALDITCHSLCTKRSVAAEHVNSHIDKQWLHVSKTMLKSNELKAINNLMHGTKLWLKKHAIPSLFRSGVYLVPNNMVADVTEYLENRLDSLSPLVTTFVHAYPSMIEEARVKLGDSFDESQYPSIESVSSLFSIDYRWVSIATPTYINSISREIYLREQRRVKQHFEEAACILIEGMREAALKMVKTLTERLDTAPGEKPKRFKSAVITRLHEWADNYMHGFSEVVYDEKLKPIAETIMMLTDIDPNDLRKDDAFRSDVVKHMSEVEERLEKMIIEKPKRSIILE